MSMSQTTVQQTDASASGAGLPVGGGHIALLATSATTIRTFCIKPVQSLIDAGLQVSVCSAPDADLSDVLPERATFFPALLTRVSTPFTDLRAIWQLFWWFRRQRFDMVQYTTPKAALLGSIAAFLARVPRRLYLIWGVYYEGQHGLRRRIFRGIEKLICALSTEVVPNSNGTIETLVNDGVVRESKCSLVYVCGVDLKEFERAAFAEPAGALRSEFDIPVDAVVIGFIGRLTRDKGVNELVNAFEQLAQHHENLYLLIAGDQEEKDRLLPETENQIRSHARIKTLGWQSPVQPVYAAIDILCLPSYREGLPQSVLEAQAMRLPIVCSDIPGCRESIDPNSTGFLVKSHSSESLLEPLDRLVKDADLRESMGTHARDWIIKHFAAQDVLDAIVRHRLQVLQSNARA